MHVKTRLTEPTFASSGSSRRRSACNIGGEARQRRWRDALLPAAAAVAGRTWNAHERRWYWPPVRRRSLRVRSHLTVSAAWLAAGLPQMAVPLATSQMTRLLSSWPPRDASSEPSAEKSTAWTATLWRTRRCFSAEAPSPVATATLRSHMMIGAWGQGGGIGVGRSGDRPLPHSRCRLSPAP